MGALLTMSRLWCIWLDDDHDDFDALEDLSWVAYRGTATREELKQSRGQDCEALLTWLHAREYLAGERCAAAPSLPYRFRLTARPIATFGASSREELQ